MTSESANAASAAPIAIMNIAIICPERTRDADSTPKKPPGANREKATKEKYFPALNNFFNDFEAKTGLEVIFAAHPRSRYDLYPEYLYKKN